MLQKQENTRNTDFTQTLNYSNHVMDCLTSIYNKLSNRGQPVITTRIYVLHKITIALKFMSYINSDLPVPVKKLQTPG